MPTLENAQIAAIEAKSTIVTKVYKPALNHPTLDKKTKDVIRNSELRLSYFDYIGDVFAYLDCCLRNARAKETYCRLSALGLLAYEDILPEFNIRYAHLRHRKLCFSDFAIGERYSSNTINILGARFDTRTGGILPVKLNSSYCGVAIKATLKGGKYPNEWLQSNNLRYYLKSIEGKFSPNYLENKILINEENLQIAVFTRGTPDEDFIYRGIYSKVQIHKQPDGALWIELSHSPRNPRQLDEINREFAEKARNASADTTENRKTRLATAPKLPSCKIVYTKVYDRNPDVVAEVLFNANGKCMLCKNAAPFIRTSDNSPFLEVHHIIPLAEGGLDTIENAIALCPNCHRQEHFGNRRLTAWKQLQDDCINP